MGDSSMRFIVTIVGNFTLQPDSGYTRKEVDTALEAGNPLWCMEGPGLIRREPREVVIRPYAVIAVL